MCYLRPSTTGKKYTLVPILILNGGKLLDSSDPVSSSTRRKTISCTQGMTWLWGLNGLICSVCVEGSSARSWCWAAGPPTSFLAAVCFFTSRSVSVALASWKLFSGSHLLGPIFKAQVCLSFSEVSCLVSCLPLQYACPPTTLLRLSYQQSHIFLSTFYSGSPRRINSNPKPDFSHRAGPSQGMPFPLWNSPTYLLCMLWPTSTNVSCGSCRCP